MGAQFDPCAPKPALNQDVNSRKCKNELLRILIVISNIVNITFFISDWLSDRPIIMEERQALEANMAEMREGRHISPCKSSKTKLPMINRRIHLPMCIEQPVENTSSEDG